MAESIRTDWIWIRHAPVQRQESRYYGRLDVAAEPVSQARAAAIARELPSVAVWLATPLSRTRSTALALKQGVDPIEIADFSDQDYGLWQGRSFNDIYAANRALDWNDPSELTPPAGESFANVRLRVGEAIERLTVHYAGHSIVAVAHTATIRAAVGLALGVDAATSMRIDIAPLSLTKLTHRMQQNTSQWSVGFINHEIGTIYSV